MRLLYKIIVAIIIVVFFGGILWYFAFEKTTQYMSYEAGTIHNKFSEQDSNDYVMIVTYTSKGAFVAGGPIHVSIDFFANQRVEELHHVPLYVIFPGSLPYPVPPGVDGAMSSAVRLNFTNETGIVAHGEGVIIYQMPDMDQGLSLVFKTEETYNAIYADFQPFTDIPAYKLPPYGYRLFVNNTVLPISYIARGNSALHVAPLETKSFITYNKQILIISVIAILLAVVQMIIGYEKKNRLSVPRRNPERRAKND